MKKNTMIQFESILQLILYHDVLGIELEGVTGKQSPPPETPPQSARGFIEECPWNSLKYSPLRNMANIQSIYWLTQGVIEIPRISHDLPKHPKKFLPNFD